VDRNYLKSRASDLVNAVLVGAGYFQPALALARGVLARLLLLIIWRRSGSDAPVAETFERRTVIRSRS
jgi:hypothetical protein